MSTATVNAEPERIADEVPGAKPTPEQIDALAAKYNRAKALKGAAVADLEEVEAEAIALVKDWGSVPPNAEKSRRLNGRLSELTVTKSDTITVSFERVVTLKEALEANDRGEYFKKLFTLNSKYEIVEGAESALKTEALPKRLAEKVLNLFGRCLTVKAKKPSLKVTIADPAKPAKKARKPESQKAGAE